MPIEHFVTLMPRPGASLSRPHKGGQGGQTLADAKRGMSKTSSGTSPYDPQRILGVPAALVSQDLIAAAAALGLIMRRAASRP